MSSPGPAAAFPGDTKDAPLRLGPLNPRRADQLISFGAAVASLTIALVCAVGQAIGDRRFFDESGASLMSPNAILSTVALASAFGLLRWWESSSLPNRIGAAAAAAAVGVTAWEFIGVPYFFRGAANIDQLLLSEQARNTGATITDLSVTAGAMVVACAIAMMPLAWRAAANRRAMTAAMVLSGTTACIGFALAVINIAGAGVLVPTDWRPESTWPAIALGFIGVAQASSFGALELLVNTLLGMPSTAAPDRAERRERNLVTIIGLAAGCGLVVLAARYVDSGIDHELADFEISQRDRLASRATAISDWRERQVTSARALARLPRIGALLNGSASREDLAGWNLASHLEQHVREYGYDGYLTYDRHLRPQISGGSLVRSELATLPVAPDRVRGAREVIETDFDRDQDGAFSMDLIVPVRSEDGKEFLGAVRLRSDIRSRLLPLVAARTRTTATEETILVRNSGPDLLIVSELRFPDATDGHPIVPATGKSLLSVKTATASLTHLVRALDYRGIEVVGIAEPVRGTNWWLIAKADATEVIRPAVVNAAEVAVGTGLALLVVGFGARSAWTRRRQIYLNEREAALQQNRQLEERLLIVMKHANDGILIFDERGRIIEANDRAANLYRRTRQSLLRLGAADLRAPGGATSPEKDLAGMMNQEGRLFETVHQRSDGTTFPAEVSSRSVEIGGAHHILSIIRDVTERKAIERTLRKLSRAIEQAPLSISITNTAGTIEYVNPEFCRTSGYASHELLGKNSRILKSDANSPAIYAQMWQTLGRGEVWRGELTNRRKNGTLLIESLVIAPVANDAGAITHYAAMKEDVTERRQTEGALREIQRRYQMIAENTVDGIWIYDLALKRFTYSSPSVFRLRGYSTEETATQQLTDAVTPASRAAIEARLAERLAAFSRGDLEARSTTLEVELVHKDGRVIPAEVVTSYLTGADGRPEAILGVTRDISERVQAAQRLRRSEELYRLIADQTSDVIWMFDFRERRLRYVSPASFRVIGYHPEEIIGQPMSFRLTAESAQQVKEGIEARLLALRAGDESARNGVRLIDYIHRDGRIVQAEAVTTVISDPDGTPVQLLGVSRDVTERELAARRLREGRDRLAKAERIAQLGNWQLDLATRQMSWSEELFRILEIDPAEPKINFELFLGRVHPDDREQVETTFNESVRTRTRYLSTHRILCPDGGVKHVETSGELVCAADGTPLHTIGTMQDISDRKLTELELHALVKQFRAMHGVALALDRSELSPGERLAFIVQHLPSALGDALNARAVLEIDGELRTAGAEGEWADRLTGDIVTNGQRRGTLTLGYVRAAAAPIPFTAQERETVEAIARSIALSMTAQESFRRLERFNVELEEKVATRTAELGARNREVQALLEAIPDLVVQLRTDGTVLSYKDARQSSTLSAPGADLVAACLAVGRQAIARAETTTSECTLPVGAASGSFELRAAPVGGDQFVVFIRDISDRKRLEAETAANLERERQVSEMKTRFISVTSHEFRTPMASIMGSVDLLHNHLNDLPPAKREQVFARIQAAMRRMTHMLDDILTLSRIDSRRVKLDPAAIQLSQFLHEVVEEVRGGDRDGHRFTFELADDPDFSCDRNTLHQIVSNLLSNAVRYSPPGREVTLRSRTAGPNLVLEVADQGIGIPPADLERVFEPFERGSNAGTIKGTGLGLNIVKRMTDLLGGEITVSSTLGQGSCFRVQLPLQPKPSSP